MLVCQVCHLYPYFTLKDATKFKKIWSDAYPATKAAAGEEKSHQYSFSFEGDEVLLQSYIITAPIVPRSTACIPYPSISPAPTRQRSPRAASRTPMPPRSSSTWRTWTSRSTLCSMGQPTSSASR